MLAAVAGCELDSRSVERIVEHSALPEREMLPHSPLIRNEKVRMNNGSFRPCQSLNSPNAVYQSGSSSSSTERAGSYIIQAGRNGDSLCGSEHYTDSGIHQTDSNHLEDDHRLLQEEREVRHMLSQEQQFGTFGRPGTMIANHHRQTLAPQYESRIGMTTGANQSEESLQPIFQSSNTFPTKPKHSSNHQIVKKSSRVQRPFCPDWRCVLMCNMIIMSLLVVIFLSGYYYIWPVYVMPLVNASQPVDGSWTKFQPWSACTATCGSGGYQTRRRFCGNPAPEDGGLNCIGESIENRTCRAELDCPDCNRICTKGTLNKNCTKCTCEHHVITGIVTDDAGNPLRDAAIYKLGHYDKLAETDRSGNFRITKICAKGDNALTVTKHGYNPKSLLPDATGNTTASGAVKLTMLLPPKITKIAESKTRFVNQAMQLCCTANDNDGSSLEIQWYKNQELIPSGAFYNQSNTNLQIKSLKLDDAGVYQCKAINRAGMDMAQEVTVTVKPIMDLSCPKKPIREVVNIGEHCDMQEINIGKCVGRDGGKGSRCLHVDQFKNIISNQCTDPPSDYCCGPVKKKKLNVSCRAPKVGTADQLTYKVPIEQIEECGCAKC